jgi:hypothetical protein
MRQRSLFQSHISTQGEFQTNDDVVVKSFSEKGKKSNQNKEVEGGQLMSNTTSRE